MARWLNIHSGGGAAVRALGLVAVAYGIAAVSPTAVPAAFSAISGEPATYGEPATAAQFWREQHTSDCGELAVADVVGEITGHEPSEQEITALAGNTPSAAGPGPIWQPWHFTDIQDLPKLLGRYGIAADNVRIDIDGLKRKLYAGQKIIAHVNAETLWNRPGMRDVADHFVVVTGIDTRFNVLHLNDSAIATGRDEIVSFAVFRQAWAPNGQAATVTH